MAPTPDDILKQVDASETFINRLVIAWREKQWVKLLLLFGFLCLLFLHPKLVDYALETIGLPKAESYQLWMWITATGSFFVAAFVVALRTPTIKFPDAPSDKSIIKGLRPYTAEDYELFTKLERGRILQDCLTACHDADFRFGILNGESGTGKTSFLQAGFCPSLKKKNFRPLYVKLTEIAPLDSIREAFISNYGINRKDAEDKVFIELLRVANIKDSQPLIIVIDQFEQFFVSHKSKAERQRFVQEMALWYKQRNTLPVKILFSIRGDFFYRLSEFQEAMNYTLTVQDNFRLEKFSPDEAANVFRVIADAERIECDENFIREITAKELSDREDGLVSPVDVQVLSWMIAGQKTKDEKAFNRQAFSKVGGVEGLLESFLKRTLDVQTESNRQTAVKVLLALTDLERNTRAGALSLDEIQAKLKETISAGDVAKSVDWLSNSGIRLITPTDERKETETLYELAHERIIPALRKLANKELSETDRASQLLDRRFNEWTGNNRSRRYLLTLKEWLLVRRNKALISLGANKELKENFIALSKRRFQQFAAGSFIIALLTVGGFGAYRWNESRIETKMTRAQIRMTELLHRNNEYLPIQNSVLLLAFRKHIASDKATAESWLEHIKKLDSTNQTKVLSYLAKSYIKFEEKEDASKGIDEILDFTVKLTPDSQDNVLASLTKNYAELKNKKQASEGLNKIQVLAEKLPDNFDKTLLLNLAEGYIKLGRNEDALNCLNKTLTLIEKLHLEDQFRTLSVLSENYTKIENKDAALNGLNKILQLAEKFPLSKQISVLASVTEGFIKLGKNEEALKLLNKTFSLINNLPLGEQDTALESLAESYSKLGKNEEALNCLNKVFILIEKLPPGDREISLSILAESYAKLENKDSALNELNKMLAHIEKFPSDAQEMIISSLAESYAKLGNSKQAQEKINKLLTHIEKLDSYDQDTTLTSIVRSYAGLENKEHSFEGLNKITRFLEEAKIKEMNLTLSTLAESYIKLDNKQQATNGLNDILRLTEKLSSIYQIRVLITLAESYIKLENKESALNGLNRIWELVAKEPDFLDNSLVDLPTSLLRSKRNLDLLPSIAQSYAELENKEAALNGLSKILEFTEKLNPDYKATILPHLAQHYIKLGKNEDALNVLAKGQEVAQKAGNEKKNQSLLEIAVLYAKIKEWEKALLTVQLISAEDQQITAYSRVLAIWKSPEKFTVLEEFFRNSDNPLFD